MRHDDMPDYEEDLRIDPDGLDLEWLNQPNVFMKYAEIAAEAEQAAKEAHEFCKVTRSRLVREANEDPAGTIGGKATKDNVEAYYREHSDHKEAKQAQIDAEFVRDIAVGIKSAFHQRKATLENLVVLHGQKYFAGPTEPRNLGFAAQAEKVGREHARDRIRSRSKRRGSK